MTEPRRLLEFARGLIAEEFGAAPAVAPTGSWFEQRAATFVTLRRGPRLHGCIGTLRPRRSIVDDVRHNTMAALLTDPRAVPLQAADVELLRIEISHLSALERVEVASEEELRRVLRPRVDGVVLTWRDRCGTFLPQVWESLPDPARFLAELKTKAGLGSAFWSADIVVERYSVLKYSEYESPREVTANA
ncbi:MAG: AmmeMemoRadiSam system protein A [Deltaproteobacteria bacterium]|nr:AmmeMemoRadiSam system protein A [Deltaproteobacteria bacterium]